jgi:DNA-repair protein complementing XP-A cells
MTDGEPQTMPRPGTPPRTTELFAQAGSPPTPEQVRRTEINRLKAKALREQREASEVAVSPLKRSDSTAAGQKRSFATYAAQTPSTVRDARTDTSINRPLEAIQPARNLAKYVEYDFSKMTDTKGGFLTADDDPHNKALHADTEGKPANMTLREWELQQRLRSLRQQRAGPFEPSISNNISDKEPIKCRECGILEVDWKWHEVFDIAVCNACKDKLPDKYSLLTKTEAREDYLLTDPELKDETLLPHLTKPNPHKSTWHDMFLYLRCQVEEYAFSDKKWGSAEALDEEFAKRETEKKKRKETKFKNKLADLKKRTRLEAHQRRGKSGGNFGDDLSDGKHVHEFGRLVDNSETGMAVKTCTVCGFEIEELEL